MKTMIGIFLHTAGVKVGTVEQTKCWGSRKYDWTAWYSWQRIKREEIILQREVFSIFVSIFSKSFHLP